MCGCAAGGLQGAEREHPDLMILDVGLPGHSGIELLNEIKCSAPMNEIPVLIMSGHAVVLVGGAVRQADATLAKPFDLADLFERVDRLTRGSSERLPRIDVPVPLSIDSKGCILT
jgi:DNA-binding response OmpR family regulator